MSTNLYRVQHTKAHETIAATEVGEAIPRSGRDPNLGGKNLEDAGEFFLHGVDMIFKVGTFALDGDCEMDDFLRPRES